jgi:hypothetical protein
MIRHPLRDAVAAALAGAYVEHRMHRHGRRARRHPALTIAGLGFVLVMLDLAAIVASHILGLVLIAAAVGAVAYLAGRRAGPASPATAAGQPRSAQPARLEPVQWTPRGGRIARPASVPAAPAAPDYSAVRRDVSSGLANLGWPVSTTREPISQAITGLQASGSEITVQSVLAAVLRDAGNRRFAPVS